MGKPPRLLTTGDVAKLTGFSASAVLQWIRTNKLPAFSSPGGQYRISSQDLAAFLKQHGMQCQLDLAKERDIRILVVDDDRLVRNSIERMLKECNSRFEVETAENGVVGCLKVPVFKPHLLVLDVVMPEMDGAEICRAIKLAPDLAHIKILLITGFPDDRRFRSALASGAEDWLAKPVRFDALKARIHALLGLDQAPGAPVGAAPNPEA